MRKIIIFLLFFISGCATTGSSPTTYNFYYNKEINGEKLKANPFISVFNIYYHGIRKVHLYKHFPESDITKIVLKIIKSLEEGKAIQLQVPNMTGSRALVMTFRTDIKTKDDKPTVFLTTNYDRKSRKAVSLSSKKSYANLFYMIGDKLVLYYYIDDPATKQELDDMTIVEKTGYFLFDDNFENDEKGMNILLKSIPKEDNRKEKVYQMLTLSYYQMMFGEYKTSRKTLDDALLLANKESNQADRNNMMYSLRIAENVYNICQEYEYQLKNKK